ncbi:hypothetical protein [Streptomyces prunicolor]|uniref:Uncharacterized protein n=1 Tax=Streptomyces prunicolor TaxID=67348 RepID=A0ABU4F5R2_9ACTN|nr:hypothetical protein [Streptomyces prunicolor]MDV7215919.1 hypothetical protein [Streptomyces prunicolor]
MNEMAAKVRPEGGGGYGTGGGLDHRGFGTPVFTRAKAIVSAATPTPSASTSDTASSSGTGAAPPAAYAPETGPSRRAAGATASPPPARVASPDQALASGDAVVARRLTLRLPEGFTLHLSLGKPSDTRLLASPADPARA